MNARLSPVAWLAVAAVAVVVILTAAGLWVFQSLRALPGDVVRGGLTVAEKAQEVAEAFLAGSVETTFVSYAAQLSGNSFLQVASLEQTEVFTRTEEGTVLWGQIPLPEVVVSATVPVQYTYYLDLDEPWRFELVDNLMTVRAPALRFNRPSLDVSELRFEVRESSLLRDEAAVVTALREGLTHLSRDRARDHVGLVRETARREVSRFIDNWLASSFKDAHRYRVEIVFADEEPESRLPRPRG